MYESLIFVAQCAVLFVISTTLFDALHFLLHRWQRSRFSVLRRFAAWHQVHHDFLDKEMNIHPELVKKNFWAHLVPEFLSSFLGTVVFMIIVPVWPVIAVCVLHIVLFGFRIVEEGMDFNHMAMDRLHGQRGTFVVGPSFHAMHHINPLGFYSSFLSLFDIIFGTAIALRGKRVLVAGARGAFGGHMVDYLTKAGAHVDGVVLRGLPSAEILGRLHTYDILVLAHGLKDHPLPTEIWAANHAAGIMLADAFIEAGAQRLVPPELWAVGSEAELVGFSDYAMSKRTFANYAAEFWWHNPDVTYRHIVPSAFSSKMGKGLMTAKFAVACSMFLITRGFRYIPVTYTGIAWINRLRFNPMARNRSRHPARRPA